MLLVTSSQVFHRINVKKKKRTQKSHSTIDRDDADDDDSVVNIYWSHTQYRWDITHHATKNHIQTYTQYAQTQYLCYSRLH